MVLAIEVDISLVLGADISLVLEVIISLVLWVNISVPLLSRKARFEASIVVQSFPYTP